MTTPESNVKVSWGSLIAFVVAIVMVLGWGFSIGSLYSKVSALDVKVSTLEQRWLDNHDMIKQIQGQLTSIEQSSVKIEKLVEKHVEGTSKP